MSFIKVIKVHEIETVEIQWTLKDNSVVVRRYTVPPRSVINHKREEEE